MKLLSFQETNFLLNPEKFNRNYQYLLTHRIKNKMKDVNRDLDFVKKHERVLLTDRKKEIYDDDQEIERIKDEVYRERLRYGRNYFTPNFKTVMRDMNVRIRQCFYPMDMLKKYLTFDKFIQKHKTMDEKGKQFLDKKLKEMQDNIQKYADEIGSLRKNLMEGYMLSSNDFKKELKNIHLKKWDYSELD